MELHNKYRAEVDAYWDEVSSGNGNPIETGYNDGYTLHADVDKSFYWFHTASMKSVKEPPPGWSKIDGQWIDRKSKRRFPRKKPRRDADTVPPKHEM